MVKERVYLPKKLYNLLNNANVELLDVHEFLIKTTQFFGLLQGTKESELFESLNPEYMKIFDKIDKVVNDE